MRDEVVSKDVTGGQTRRREKRKEDVD